MLEKLATIADYADYNGQYEFAGDVTQLLKNAQLFDALRTLFDPGFSGLDRDAGYWKRLQRGWSRGRMDRGVGLLLAINAERTKLNRKIEELALPIKDFQEKVSAFYDKIRSGADNFNSHNVKEELRTLSHSIKEMSKLVGNRELRKALDLRNKLNEQQLKALDKVKGLDEETKAYLANVLKGETQPSSGPSEQEPGAAATMKPSKPGQVDSTTALKIARWLRSLGIKARNFNEGRKSKNVNMFRAFINLYQFNPMAVLDFFNANPQAMEKGLDLFGQDFSNMYFWAENVIKRDQDAADNEAKEQKVPGAPAQEAPVAVEEAKQPSPSIQPAQEQVAPVNVVPSPLSDITDVQDNEAAKAARKAKAEERKLVKMLEEKMKLEKTPKVPPTPPSSPAPEQSKRADRVEQSITRFGRMKQVEKFGGQFEELVPDDDEESLAEYMKVNKEPVKKRCNCENTKCDDHQNTYCNRSAGKQRAMYVGALCDECAERMPTEYMIEDAPEEAPDADIFEAIPEGRERFNEEKHVDEELVESYKGRKSDKYDGNDEDDIQNLMRNKDVYPEYDEDYFPSRQEPTLKPATKEEELGDIMSLIRVLDKKIERMEANDSTEDRIDFFKDKRQKLLNRKNELSGLPAGW